jgi:hypothetical protein
MADVEPQHAPTGSKREVQMSQRATIGGVPVSYVAMMSAVIAVLALIPFSMVMGTGTGSFPLSEAVIPFSGVLLGPVAGPLSALIGSALGLAIAPHTAASGILTPIPYVVGSWAAACIVSGKKWLWVWPFAVTIGVWGLEIILALSRNVPINLILAMLALVWICLILYLTPIRSRLRSWIGSKNPMLLIIGLALATFMGTATVLCVQSTVNYILFGWPTEVWAILIPIVPTERLTITVAGTVISTGVILGLRSVGAPKPPDASW